MSPTIITLFAFIIALGIGIFLGKLLAKTQAQSDKSGLE